MTSRTLEAASPPHPEFSSASSVVCVLALLIVTVLAPRMLLLTAPLLFGVPHVAQDLRCLWLRLDRGLPRSFLLGVGCLLALMLVRRAALVADLDFIHHPWLGTRLEIALGVLVLATAAALTPSTTPRRRRVLPVLAVVAGAALAYSNHAVLALGHLHNFVALGLLFYFLRRVPIAFVLATTLAIIALGFTPLLDLARDARLDDFVPSAFDWWSLERTLAPGVAPDLAARLVLIFAFAQAMHYAAWLWWIPSAVTPRTTTAQDFGRAGFACLLLLTLAIPLWGLFDPIGSRTTYLSLVFFHGWIELAVIVHLALRSDRSTSATPQVAA